MQQQPFTVVGLYSDTHQRFCDTIYADNAAAAEEFMNDAHSTLQVVAVFAGDLTPLDIDPHGD